MLVKILKRNAAFNGTTPFQFHFLPLVYPFHQCLSLHPPSSTSLLCSCACSTKPSTTPPPPPPRCVVAVATSLTTLTSSTVKSRTWCACASSSSNRAIASLLASFNLCYTSMFITFLREGGDIELYNTLVRYPRFNNHVITLVSFSFTNIGPEGADCSQKNHHETLN